MNPGGEEAECDGPPRKAAVDITPRPEAGVEENRKEQVATYESCATTAMAVAGVVSLCV